MAKPLDAVTAIHNAFRADIARIDAAAYDAARGRDDLDRVVERYRFFNEVLEWHAHGEELAVFPAVANVVPEIAEDYERDHRSLDELFETLHEAISTTDPLVTARVTSAFKFFLGKHLDKEDAHLYQIVGTRFDMPRQGKIVGTMASTVPQERMPDLVNWMFPLLGDDDRENMTRIWKMVMPPEAFAGAAGLIRSAVGGGWSELTRRIPELTTVAAVA